MRTFLAGLLGGIVLFIWGAIFHAASPMGMIGFKTMAPDKETAVLEAIKGAMSERQIYFFPGFDMSDPKGPESEPFKSRIASGPTGLVVFNPNPGVMMDPKQLGGEALFNLAECIIAAFIVASFAASVGYWGRVLSVALIGLSATLMVDGSYWLWYHFPCNYFLAQMFEHTFGGLLAGLVIAKIVAKRAA